MNTIEQIVNPDQFGIEKSKADELVGNLPQIKAERDVLESQYNEIIRMDIESSTTAKAARECRLRIRDNRTKGIEVWHKTTKDFFLKGGQFVDAIKRKEVEVNTRMELALEEIEKYQEIKEQKRLDELELKRRSELEPFAEFVPFGANIRTISNEDFVKILNGAKLQMDAKIAAEKKSNEERIAREKAELEERERIRIENERLKKEAEERDRLAKIEAEKRSVRVKELEPYIIFIRDYNGILSLSDIEYKKQFSEIKRGAEEHWEFERKEQLRKAKEEEERIEKERKERQKLEAKLKLEREEKQLIENELRKKQELEQIEKKKEAEAERNAKNAPDKDKLISFNEKLKSIDLPILKGDEANAILADVKILIGKINTFIETRSQSL